MILEKFKSLLEKGEISQRVCENLSRWISLGRDEKALEELLEENNLEEIRDAFSQTIPFGTAGRRGEMGIGPNRINYYTMMDSGQGVINYLQKINPGGKFSVVIAYDTRHNSKEYAQAIAQVFAANDAKVYLYPSFTSTPKLSFSVRYLKTSVGIMISASHNPPGDNGIKVYWSDGAQVVPPHDEGIMMEVEKVEQARIMDFERALEEKKIVYVDEELEKAYMALLASQSLYPERDLKIIFSPLHGVGLTNAYKGLQNAGFQDIVKVEKQCEPSGDFPHVAHHIPNPEIPSAMEESLKLGFDVGADIALVTDPDADRLGVGVRTQEGWRLLTGDEIGILIAYHILSSLKEQGKVPPKGVVIKNIPTTDMITKIAHHFGVKGIGHVLVGFKYIGYEIENFKEGEVFLCGIEVAHGYLLNSEIRDKDGAMAALAIAEIAAHLKKQNRTLIDSLRLIYQEVGYYKNIQESFTLPGLSGKEKIDKLMERFRQNPPEKLGPLTVEILEDYATLKRSFRGGEETEKIDYPFTGDTLLFYLKEEGAENRQYRFILRPSGTEPKVKIYLELACAAPQEDFSSFQLEMDKKAQGYMKEIILSMREGME